MFFLSYGAYYYISNIWFTITIAFCFLYVLFEKPQSQFGKTDIYFVFAFLAFLAVITLIWAPDRQTAIAGDITFFKLMLLSISVYFSIDTPRKFSIALYFIIIGVYSMIVVSIFYYGIDGMIDSIKGNLRLGYGFSAVNAYGESCYIAFFLSLYLGFIKKKKIFLLISLPLAFFGALTQSKRAIFMIGLIVLFFIVFLFRNWHLSKKQTIIILAGSAFVIIAVFFLVRSMPVFARINDFILYLFSGESEVDASTSEREQMIMLGLQLISKNPFFGYGAYNYSFFLSLETGNVTYSHNNYIELMVSFGIFGLFAWLSIYLKGIFQSLKKIKEDTVLYVTLGFCLILIISETMTVTYRTKTTYLLIGLIYAYIANIIFQNSHELKSTISMSAEIADSKK